MAHFTDPQCALDDLSTGRDCSEAEFGGVRGDGERAGLCNSRQVATLDVLLEVIHRP